MIVLGIAGSIGSGKDTAHLLLTEMLALKGLKSTKLSFAKPLKKFLSENLGWDPQRLDLDLAYKEGGLPGDPACELLGMTRRQVMQRVGTEGLRQGVHPDFWVILLELAIRRGEYDQFQVGVLTDVRFLNELEFVRRNNGFLLKLVGGVHSTETTHASEISLDAWTDWNAVIENLRDPDLSREENLDRLAFKLRREVLPGLLGQTTSPTTIDLLGLSKAS